MPKTTEYHHDWAEMAFGSKKPLKDLRAIFIAAPRAISPKRFNQLLKAYLPKGNVVLGIAKEPYVVGLENQKAFSMLQLSAVQPTIEKINAASPTHKVRTLSYFQRDLCHLLEKLAFSKAIFIRGSWYHAFHLRPEFYTLINLRIPYQTISPFSDEAEAKAYAQAYVPAVPQLPSRPVDEKTMLELAQVAASQSFAYSEHQTGIALGRRQGKGYQAVTTAFNRVVPYQTFAMHFGASREDNFSPMNDLNHYDASHAEVELLVQALHDGTRLVGTTLFINVMPCPTCARMLTATDIDEIVYQQDHSGGYAIRLLTEAGKKVRRVV
nr:Cytidine and deoxycytidylate deaminase zinc-binding region [uncultured bacterium]